MATTTWDVTAEEVLETVGFSGATSANPSTTVIGKWITRFAADINLALRGIGITPSGITTSTDDELYQAIRQKIIARCCAEWIMANRHEMTDYVQTLIDEFTLFVESLRTMPSHVTGETGHSASLDSYPQTVTSLQLVTEDPDHWLDKDSGFG